MPVIPTVSIMIHTHAMWTMMFMFSFLEGFPLLACSEILAALLVAIGCIGELILVFQKPPLKEEESRAFEKRKHFLERVFVCMVAIGVTMELALLPLSLRESARLNKEAGDARKLAAESNERSKQLDLARIGLENQLEELYSTNLVLEKQVVALQITLEKTTNVVANIRPRQLTIDQMDRLSIFLRSKSQYFAGTHVRLKAPPQYMDNEAFMYASDIQSALWMGVGGLAPRDIEPIDPREAPGLTIRYPSFSFGPEPGIVGVLKQGFSNVKVDCDVWGKSHSGEDVEVVVGRRKPPPEERVTYSMLVFNGSGFIIRDLGAGKFISKNGIHVSLSADSKIHVRIDFNRAFSDPPLLRLPVGGITMGEPSSNLGWEFDLMAPSPPTSQTNWIFRLEIIP